MGALLDPLLKAGALSRPYVFASTFPKQYTGKVLMMVGPAWYQGAIFALPLASTAAKGTIAAYPPLQWAGSPKAWTGDVGGGLWIMSSHTSNPRPSRRCSSGWPLRQGRRTSRRATPGTCQLRNHGSPRKTASGFWATPLAPAFATAANEVWPGWAETPWDVYGIWASTVLPNLTAGQSFSSQLPGFAAAISELRPK